MDGSQGKTPEQGRRELSQLTDYRRYTYAVASITAMAIFFVSWLFRHPHDVFIAVGYPIFSVIYGVSCAMLINGRVRLRLLEVGLVSLMAVIVLSRLAWHFIAGDPFGANFMPLVSGHYWAVGILIVLAFIALGFRAGMAVAVVAFTFSALLATGASLKCGMMPAADCSDAMYFLRIHLFLLALLALTSAGTLLRDRTFAAIARAEVLEKLSETDALTGLANREGAQAYLETAVTRARTRGEPLALTLVDLDHFRRINAAHGLATGDQVIRRVAELLSETYGDRGLVARWGSDQFLVVRPGEDDGDALHRAEHCRWRLEQAPIAGLAVTATFGVARCHPERDWEDVLHRTDQALRQARANGHNTVAAAPEPRVSPRGMRRQRREDASVN